MGGSPVRQASDVIARRVAGEVLLVPLVDGVALATDRIFVLNRVGAFLWESLDGVRGPETLAARVRERFDVGAEKDVLSDVLRFLEALEARHLVTRAP